MKLKPEKKLRDVITFLVVLTGIAISGFTTGCEAPPPPYVPKASLAPEVICCNDYTGHKPGTKPWIMGGTCTCTPTEELMKKLHADGFCNGINASDLRAMYEKAGMKLRSPDHLWCNGLCDAGPHVVLGGKCMCPPTPGTAYFEKVVTSERTVAQSNESNLAAQKP